MAYATDTFDGGAAALTSPWVQVGIGANLNRNGSGAAQAASAANVAAAYQAIVTTDEQVAIITIGSVAGGSGHFAGALVCASGTGGSFAGYTLEGQGGSNNLSLNLWQSGGFVTTLAVPNLAAHPTALASGDIIEVVVDTSGADPAFTFFHTPSGGSRTEIGTFTDTTTGTPPTGTGVGVLLYAETTASGITVVDWEGGDLGGGGGPTIEDISGTAAGTSTASAAASLTVSIAGTLAGTSTASASATAQRSISGTAAGTSTMTGGVTTTTATDIAGTLAGTSTLTADLSLDIFRTQTLAGTSTMTGAITTTGVVEIAGTAAGTSTASAAASLTISIGGTLAGTSTASGAISIAGVAILSGTLAGSSTMTAELSIQRAIAGAIAGTSQMSGAVSRRVSVVGTLAGTSAMTGALAATPPLSPATIQLTGQRSIIRLSGVHDG